MSIWTDLTFYTWYSNFLLGLLQTLLTSKPRWKALPVTPHVWQWGVEMLPDMFVYFYFFFCHFTLFFQLLHVLYIHPSTSIHPKKKYCPTCRTWGHSLSLYFPYLPTFIWRTKIFNHSSTIRYRFPTAISAISNIALVNPLYRQSERPLVTL